MPWGVAAAVAGAATSSLLAPSGGGGGAGQVASGVTNIAGGMLSASDANQFATNVANTANPFGQYNNQFGAQLATAANNGTYGNAGSSTLSGLYAQQANTTLPLMNSLDGVSIGKQLTNLVNNPSSIYSTPQYQAAFQQGQNAVNTTLAAQGLNESGNQLAALQNYGQSFGANYYGQMLTQLSGLYGQALTANNQNFNQSAVLNNAAQSQNNQAFQQLALLSGASSGSPAAAAAAMSNIYGNVYSSGQAIGTGVGQVASGAGNLLNGLSGMGSSGGYNFTTPDNTTTTTAGSSGIIDGGSTLYGPSTMGVGSGGWTYTGDGTNWGFTGG